MSRRIHAHLVISCFALGTMACAGSPTEDDRLVAYREHVASARDLVEQQTGSGTNADDATYHAKMEDHLQAMGALRAQMMHQCEENEMCPEGGGWTGQAAGHCGGHGRMLDAAAMTALRDGEAAMNAEMEDFEQHCLDDGRGEDDHESHRNDHLDHMEDELDDHYEHCTQMMDDHPVEGGDEGPMCGHHDA